MIAIKDIIFSFPLTAAAWLAAAMLPQSARMRTMTVLCLPWSEWKHLTVLPQPVKLEMIRPRKRSSWIWLSRNWQSSELNWRLDRSRQWWDVDILTAWILFCNQQLFLHQYLASFWRDFLLPTGCLCVIHTTSSSSINIILHSKSPSCTWHQMSCSHTQALLSGFHSLYKTCSIYCFTQFRAISPATNRGTFENLFTFFMVLNTALLTVSAKVLMLMLQVCTIFRWCKLLRWQKLQQIVVTVLHQVGQEDYVRNADCFPYISQAFEMVSFSESGLVDVWSPGYCVASPTWICMTFSLLL